MFRFLLAAIVLAAALPAGAGDIHGAASSGDVARVQVLLDADKDLLDSPDASGAAPLHWAAAAGSAAVAQLLLARGANVNVAKPNGVTPLHVAAGMGNREVVELLLNSGADMNARDGYGRTPLSLARFRGHGAVAELLVSRGAEDTAADSPSVPDALVASITGRPVFYARDIVRGVRMNVIYVNMNDPGIRISAATAQNGIGSGEAFGSFLDRLQPTAAINGTFFSNSNLKPIGDIVIGGRMVHFGGMGTGLCVGQGNKVAFVDVVRGRHTDWSSYQTVVCSGPRLIRNGVVGVDAKGQGFRDPHVLGRARRTAVGLTHLNRLVLVNTLTSCSLDELGHAMRELGCVEAVNFDGGSSIGMHYRGRTITSPGRPLTNVLLVYEQAGASPMRRAAR